MQRVLNVGGNSKAIPLPPQYADFDHWLLYIDPPGAVVQSTLYLTLRHHVDRSGWNLILNC